MSFSSVINTKYTEIYNLLKTYCIEKNDDLEIFFIPSRSSSPFLKFIAEQRSTAFNKISTTINDCFFYNSLDSFYNHLVLWDSKNNRLNHNIKN